MNIHQLSGTVDGDPQTFKAGDKNKHTFRLAEEGAKAWHNVVVWEGDAPVPKKGDFIYVEGRVGTRSYEQDGSKRYVTETTARVIRQIGQNGQQPPAESDLFDE